MHAPNKYYAPSLHCIIGQRAGTTKFSGYSEDFKEAAVNIVWTEELLLDYLASQKDFISNRMSRKDTNIMMNLAWPDLTFRVNIAAYLKSKCAAE